jgi:hypothetical protein
MPRKVTRTRFIHGIRPATSSITEKKVEFEPARFGEKLCKMPSEKPRFLVPGAYASGKQKTPSK